MVPFSKKKLYKNQEYQWIQCETKLNFYYKWIKYRDFIWTLSKKLVNFQWNNGVYTIAFMHTWMVTFMCCMGFLSWIKDMERNRLRFVTTSWGFSFIQRTYEGLFCMQYLRQNLSIHFYGTCPSIIWTHCAPHFTHTLGQVRAKFLCPNPGAPLPAPLYPPSCS
jgi:hypothetical protein